jgi:hypothetical protein
MPLRTRGPSVRRLASLVLSVSSAAACTDGDSAPDRPKPDGSAASTMVDGSVLGTLLDAGGKMPGDAAPASYRPLIDNQGWRRYDATLDPLRSHQPAELSCAASATFVEYGSFEIDTTRCNYVLSEHPAQLAIPAGTQVKLELLHYDLTAPEPAEAHLAVLFADALQWETKISIPKAGDVVKANFVATRGLAVGEQIRLHLHNHGGNAYLVVALQAAVQ